MTIDDPLWMQGNGTTPAYSAREDRLLLEEMWDEGVRSLAHFKVSQRAAGANFSVDVSAGVAVVKGDDQTDQGSYLVRSTAVENVAISAAPGSNQRYDIVCLRINDPNAGGNSGSSATIVVTAGTPSASPAVPTVPASSLLLAIIGPITPATASITTSLIHDAQTGTGPTGVAAAHLMRGERQEPGVMRDWAGPTSTIPNGWLACDGSSQLRSAYPDLFATIGTTYGTADGTHFNLPPAAGRTTIGAGTGSGLTARALGATGGEETHQLTLGELATHNHGGATGTESATHSHNVAGTTGIESAGHTHNVNDPKNGATLAAGGTGSSTSGITTVRDPQVSTSGTQNQSHTHDFNVNSGTESATHTHTISNAGSNTAHNNMQPFLAVNKIIRT